LVETEATRTSDLWFLHSSDYGGHRVTEAP
jgi:hypothetical protein